MDTRGAKFIKTINWIAGAVALAVSIVLPAGYFFLAYQSQTAALGTEAEINARIVTQLINANPDLWIYEEDRLAELLDRRPTTGQPEIRRILDNNGRLIFASRQEVAPPLFSRADDLLDAGLPVGKIIISRSLRPLLLNSGLGALLGLGLGALIFFVLRLLPLRALRQAQDDLRREKEQAQITLHSIGDGVIATDRQGRVTVINKVAAKLTGWERSAAVGRSLPEIFHIINEQTGEVCENPAMRVLKNGETVELANHTILIARDGHEYQIADSAAPIRDRQDKISGAVLVFRDVTEEIQIRNELAKTQKMEAIGTLAGGIAHDFNNLLTAILGNTNLARVQINTPDLAVASLVKAETAVKRAKGLTRQLLTFAKGGLPVKKMTSLAAVLNDVGVFAVSGSKAKIEFTIADDLWGLEIDEGQISQAVSNLIINAMQAMPDGGVIKVAAENVTVGPDSDLPLPAGPYIEVTIADEGQGIAADHLARIFEPYFSTKAEGSGLGLAGAYSIVNNHHGHIAVVSEPGYGAVFTIFLPASGKPFPPPAEKKAVLAAAPVGKHRILVMDDDELIREVATGMLRHFGYEVECVADGAAALELYVQNKEAGRPFAVVIMDLTIPDGMGGKEAIGRLLAIDPAAKAIVSSGYSSDPIMADPRRYGFKATVTKPYLMEDMRKILQELLGDGRN